MMTFWVLGAATSTDATVAASELDYSGLFIKMVILLILIVVMGFVLMRYLGHSAKARGRGSGAHFELISWFRLEPKKTVYLLKIGKRIFAVGSGDSQLNLLAEIDASDLE